jgi:hypothetical protein
MRRRCRRALWCLPGSRAIHGRGEAEQAAQLCNPSNSLHSSLISGVGLQSLAQLFNIFPLAPDLVGLSFKAVSRLGEYADPIICRVHLFSSPAKMRDQQGWSFAGGHG